MKISLRFLTFCLITTLLITSYRAAVRAAPINTPVAPMAGQQYTIAQLFAIINTSNANSGLPLSSNFIYTPDGVNSYGAAGLGFTAAWAQNNNTVVTLMQDQWQVQNLKNRGVLPNASVMKALRNAISNASTQKNTSRLAQLQQISNLLNNISNNFPKIMLYFNAVSPTDGRTYNLYITDPCPGNTNWGLIISGRLNPQTNIPAYTNVLSHWSVQ